MTRAFCISAVLGLALSVVACGDDGTSQEAEARPFGPGSGTDSEFLLKTDPEGGLSVLEGKQHAAGETVTVVGRVRRIDGKYAMFSLFDESLKFCGQGEEKCGCPTPWDYCCETADMSAGALPIELRDENGLPLKTDNLGIRRLDLVAVTGKLEKTDAGNLILVADSGWFRRDRPDFSGDELDWQKDN